MRVKVIFGVVALTLIVVMAAGCASVTGLTEKEGSVTLKSQNGDTVISSESKLPDNFPSGIPMPEELVITASIVSEEKGNITVSFETELPFEELKEIYMAYVEEAQYEQVLRMEEEGYYMYSGQRGEEKETFVFNLTQDLETKKLVYGSIVYQKKQA